MNDELTPDERAALRARIMGGARDIAPAGAHRGAWIAGSVAAVLIVAIAGGVAATSTLSAPPVATTPSPSVTPAPDPTPTRTPAPTPTPTASVALPSVAFDGDCEALLGADEVGAFVAGAELWTLGDTIASTPPSRSQVYALLGGLSCWWVADDDAFGITVLPRSVVPDAVIDGFRPDTRCDDGMVCAAQRTVGDLWVGVQWREPWWQREEGTYGDPAELARVDEAALRVLETVTPRVQTTTGVPRPGLPAAALPACSTFDDTVREWAHADIETGYPSDNVPSGLLWDLTVAAGVDRWCGWFHNPEDTADRSLAVRFYVQPLLGAPGMDELESTAMTPIEIPGTSAAWLAESPTYPGTVSAIAVIGTTRLSLVGSTRDVDEWRDLISRIASSMVAQQ